MKQMFFHQYQRYQSAKWVIDTLRTKPKLRILEVGSGSHANLAQFLPQDDLTFSDIVLTDEALQDPRFVPADVRELPFEDDSFDFVISLDMLEHIPDELRASALASMLRVARQAVFLSFPHATMTASRNDAILAAQYEVLGIQAPLWVYEHCEHSLPTALRCISDLPEHFSKEKVVSFSAANTNLIRKMLQLESMHVKFPQLRSFFGAINDYYVTHLAAYDMCGDGGEQENAKTCMVLCKQISPEVVREKLVIEDGEKSSANQELIDEIDGFLACYFPILIQPAEEETKVEQIPIQSAGKETKREQRHILSALKHRILSLFSQSR